VDVQILLLILIAVALVFGFGVVLLNRRGRGGAPSVPPVVSRPVERPPIAEPAADLAREATIEGIAEEPVAEPFVEPVVESVVEPEPIAEAPSFRSRMGRAAAALAGAFGGVRARSGITDDTWDELEEALLRADVGIGVTTALLDGLRRRVAKKEISTADELLAALQFDMVERLRGADRSLHWSDTADRVNVWLFVGVNGVGKTTTIGKVSAQQVAAGRSVVLAAGDTFRAAAAEQLGTWAERSGAELVRGAEGGDPSSVIFDGVQRAKSRGADLVLGDTAGRLQNKSNLMEELRKVRRVADREPGLVSEVLLVIDATTGQNGLSQAREFTEAAGVTGVVLTKLDGSAKGGIVFAIETEFGIPVKLVGLGETIGDLVPFDPDEFVGALFAS
jgi:fused signal recognition particle receptor